MRPLLRNGRAQCERGEKFSMAILSDFKTEYQVNPLAIETRKPRFCWRYGEGFTREQVSYRILVATSEQGVCAGKADMWDSGVVQSGECVGIEYAGKALCSRSRYYVRAVSVDSAGEVHESEIHTFETALCDSDWKGSWVSVPVNFNGGTLLFRKIIELDPNKKAVRARAYICGLGYHEFFVNGKKAGNGVLNPGVTEYSRRLPYCAYEMDLVAGKNVIGIEVGYGWLGERKLLAQMYVEYDDGTVLEEHSGPCGGWWVGGSPTVENGVYSGEVYDARIEKVYPRNWNTLEYEPTWANGWMYTIYAAPPAGKLEAQQIEPIEVCAQYPETARTHLGNGVFVIDVGQNISGWLRIRIKGERGARITLQYGEELKADGTVNRINLRSARCSDTYILKGEGTEEFAPRFTFHGFRYVQAEITGKAELCSCVGEHVHTATRVTGAFDCSDAVLNRLHKMAVLTELNNEHAVLSDCPQRDERFGWLNDLSARVYQTVYNVDMARFFPKFVRNISDTQTPKGEIADTAPYFTGGVPADPVCVIYPLLANYAYRYYGDRETARAEYAGIKKWVEYLLSRSDGYIMDYYYYADWVPPFADVKADEIYVSSVFLLWHLREMRTLAQITGNAQDERTYARHARMSAEALHKKYYNGDTGNYGKGTQTENALAVSLGVAPQEIAARVAENIYRDCVARGHHCTSGNVGYRHVFYVLAEYGYADEVLAILRNPEYPGWGYMVAKGATTVWERWEAEMQNEMHSFNHPMFGSYDAFFYRFLAGIKICDDAFGCNKIAICPVFADGVDYATGSLQTVRGKIVSGWKRENGKIAVHIEIPPHTQAECRIGSRTLTLGAGVYDYIV